MLSIGLMLLLSQGNSCASCTVEGARVLLCDTHAADERILLAREEKRVRSSNEGAALEALEAIASLTFAHPDAPSPRVVEALSDGLRSRHSTRVRIRAVELLGPPQHARASLEALLPVFVRTDKETEGIFDAEMASELQFALEMNEVLIALIERTGTKDKAELKKAKDAAKEIRGTLARVAPKLELRSALLRRLALFPDDRVVSTILDSTAPPSLESVDVLLVLGSRPAIEHVLRLLKAWSDAPPVYEKHAVELREARGRRLQESLRNLASRRGLLPCPEVSEGPCPGWAEWWEASRSSFPETLPGVTSAQLPTGETTAAVPR